MSRLGTLILGARLATRLGISSGVGSGASQSIDPADAEAVVVRLSEDGRGPNYRAPASSQLENSSEPLSATKLVDEDINGDNSGSADGSFAPTTPRSPFGENTKAEGAGAELSCQDMDPSVLEGSITMLQEDHPPGLAPLVRPVTIFPV
jgi:hypothetical protein